MKKVKIMLLSLALFAVVGGALAFKAKIDGSLFCTAPAYQDLGTGTFYCAFNPGTGTVTKKCAIFNNISKIDPAPQVQPVCTTTRVGANTDAKCATLNCDVTTSLLVD